MNKALSKTIGVTQTSQYIPKTIEKRGLYTLHINFQPLIWLTHHLQEQLFIINRAFYRRAGLSYCMMVFFFWKLSGFCLYGNFENTMIRLRKGPVLSSLDSIWAFWTPQVIFKSIGLYEMIIVVFSFSFVFLFIFIVFLILQATRFRSMAFEFVIGQSFSVYYYCLFPFVTEFCFLPFSCQDNRLIFLKKIDSGEEEINMKCNPDDFLVLQGLAIPIMMWNLFLVFFVHPRINCSLQGDLSDFFSRYNTSLENGLAFLIIFQAGLQIFSGVISHQNMFIISLILSFSYAYLAVKIVVYLPYKSLIMDKFFAIFFNILLFKHSLRSVTHIVDLSGTFNSGFEAYSFVIVCPVIAKLTNLIIDRKIERVLGLTQNELDHPFLIIHYSELLQKLLAAEELQTKNESVEVSETEIRLKGIFKHHKVICVDLDCPCQERENVESHVILYKTITQQIKNIFETGLEKFPNNKTLIIFYSNFALQIEKLPIKAYHMLEKVGADLMSKEAILRMNIMERLKTYVKHEWSKQQEVDQNEQRVDPRDVLLCEQIENELRELATTGIDMLLNFWGELYKPEQDMGALLFLATSINLKAKDVRLLENSLETFDDKMIPYLSRLHIYIDIFNYIVGNDLLQGMKFANQENAFDKGGGKRRMFRNQFLASAMLDRDNPLGDENLIILKMSIQEKNMGSIVDITSNSLMLLGIKREHLLEQPIEKIMPKQFAEVHQTLLHQYVRKGSTVETGQSRRIFALDARGYCVPVMIRYNYEPNLETGLHLIAMLQVVNAASGGRGKGRKHFIITNQTGSIDSFTEELGTLLNLQKTRDRNKKYIFDICRKLKPLYKELNISVFGKETVSNFLELSMVSNQVSNSESESPSKKPEPLSVQVLKKGINLRFKSLSDTMNQNSGSDDNNDEYEFIVRIEQTIVGKKIIRVVELQELALTSTFQSSLPNLTQNNITQTIINVNEHNVHPPVIIVGAEDGNLSMKNAHDSSLLNPTPSEKKLSEFIINDEDEEEPENQKQKPEVLAVIKGAKTSHHTQEKRVKRKRPPPKVRAEVNILQHIFDDEEEVNDDDDFFIIDAENFQELEPERLYDKKENYHMKAQGEIDEKDAQINILEFIEHDKSSVLNQIKEIEEPESSRRKEFAEAPANISKTTMVKDKKIRQKEKEAAANTDDNRWKNSIKSGEDDQNKQKTVLGIREKEALKIEGFMRTDISSRIEALERTSIMHIESTGSIQFLLKNYSYLQRVLKAAPLTLELKIFKNSTILFSMIFLTLVIVNSFTIQGVFQNLQGYDLTINNLDMATFNLVQIQRSITMINGVVFDKTFPKSFSDDPKFDVNRAKAVATNIQGMNDYLNSFNDNLKSFSVNIKSSYELEVAIWVTLIDGQKVIQKYTLFSALQLIKNSAYVVAKMADSLESLDIAHVEFLTDNIMNNILLSMEGISEKLRDMLENLIKKDWQTIQVVFATNVCNVTFFILLLFIILFNQNRRLEQISSLLSTLRDEQIEENIDRLRRLRLLLIGEGLNNKSSKSSKSSKTMSNARAKRAKKRRFTKTPTFRNFHSNRIMLFVYLFLICLAPLIINLSIEFSYISASFQAQQDLYNKITVISRDRLLQKTFMVMEFEMIISRSKTLMRNNNVEDEIITRLNDISNIGLLYNEFFKDETLDPDFVKIISNNMCAIAGQEFCDRVPSMVNKGYMEARGSKLSYIKRVLEIWIEKDRTRAAAVHLLNDPLTLYLYNIDSVETQITSWMLTSLRDNYRSKIDDVLSRFYIYLIVNILIICVVSLTLWNGIYSPFFTKYNRVMLMFNLINYEYVKENKFISNFLIRLVRRTDRFSFKWF